jgi:hypothetical protein
MTESRVRTSRILRSSSHALICSSNQRIVKKRREEVTQNPAIATL